MTQINNRFKVKKGLEVTGDAAFLNNVSVTGDLTVVTQAPTDNTTKVASTAFVKKAVSDLVAASPAALDTLNELAAALGNDASFSTTVTNNLALKAPLASPALTGVPTVPTAAVTTDTTQVASTAFVQAQKASPVFTGTPVSTTASVDTNTNQIATTAFVLAQAASSAPLMDNVATVGISTRFARQDHVHASDTKKASLAGDTFTGAVNFSALLTANNNIHMTGAKVLQNTDNDLVLQSVAVDKDIVFNTLGINERMRIKSTGNVLIGTSVDNGTDDLQINGTVSATTFKGGAALTGTPTAPNALAGTNNAQIANTAYVDAGLALKANSANPTFSGNTTFTGGIGSSDVRYAAFVGGGNYNTANATVTGAFKITLPVLYNQTLLKFTLSVYEQSSQKAFDLVLAGYNNSTSTWANTSAYMMGDTLARVPNVRFGNDGTNCCIWIGDTTDTWSYPQLTVKDVKFGLVGAGPVWLSGWSIAPVTTFDTVKVGPRVPARAAAVDSPSFIGTPRVPNVAANDNSTLIANTAYVDAADALKAPIASPALTGIPTAPTAIAGTSTTQIATTEYVSTAVANLVASAPAALNTLKELSDALGGDANFANSVTTSIGLKAPLASPALTGVPVAPTAAVDTNTTQIATTQYVANQGYAKVVDGYAKIANQTFTGTPSAPTPDVSDRSTRLATTDFVYDALNSYVVKSIAGAVGVTLTATEAQNHIIYLSGAITANIAVTFPSLAGNWIILNGTSGAYTVTVKTATGNGIVVAQSYSANVFCDGTNMFYSQSDMTNSYLAGNPTATTQASTDSSTRIATTAFVKAQNYLVPTSTIDGGSF